jgi:hypothetical protein
MQRLDLIAFVTALAALVLAAYTYRSMPTPPSPPPFEAPKVDNTKFADIYLDDQDGTAACAIVGKGDELVTHNGGKVIFVVHNYCAKDQDFRVGMFANDSNPNDPDPTPFEWKDKATRVKKDRASVIRASVKGTLPARTAYSFKIAFAEKLDPNPTWLADPRIVIDY